MLVFYPATGFNLVWDDLLFLDFDTSNLDSFLSAFNNFILGENYFRPVVLLTFYIQKLLGFDSPYFYHLVNICIHVLNSILVLLIYSTLNSTKRSYYLLLIGLLYALHPLTLESVVFVSGRFDLMLAVFLLGILLINNLEFKNEVLKISLICCLYLLACLSKEMAAGFLLFFICWNKFHKIPVKPQLYISILLISFLYLAIRYACLGYLITDAEIHNSNSYLQKFLLFMLAIKEYLLIIFLPFFSIKPIHYQNLPLELNNLLSWSGILVIPLLTASGYLLKRNLLRYLLILSGLFCILFPVLHILPLQIAGNAIVAERFLYFPYAGLLIMCCALLRQSDKVMLPVSFLLITLCGLAYQTTNTLPHWKTEQTLWSWAYKSAPQSEIVQKNLSLGLFYGGNYDDGVLYTEKFLKMRPQNDFLWNTYGLNLSGLKKYYAAEKAFRKSIDINPSNLYARVNLSSALREQNKLVESQKIIDEVLRRFPDFKIAQQSYQLLKDKLANAK